MGFDPNRAGRLGERFGGLIAVGVVEYLAVSSVRLDL